MGCSRGMWGGLEKKVVIKRRFGRAGQGEEGERGAGMTEEMAKLS